MNIHQYERATTRKGVDWLAHASNPHVHLIGARVRDVSANGAFLEKTTVYGSPLPGDTLDLDLFAFGSNPTLRTRGIVAWVGHSHQHNCEGIGIRFEEPTDLVSFS